MSRRSSRVVGAALLYAALGSFGFVAAAEAASRMADYQYVSPLADAKMVSRWNNIVIRQGEPIDPATLRDDALVVTGSRTGRHDGRLVLSDDGRTLVFTPREPFATGESVVVRLEAGVSRRGGAGLPPLAYRFEVSRDDPKLAPALETLLPNEPDFATQAAEPEAWTPGPLRADAQACDTLPLNYPNLTLTAYDNPAPGRVFLTPRPGTAGRLLILDHRAKPIFYRRLTANGSDFMRQPSGLLTYFSAFAYHALDSAYAEVDSFKTGNGYTTDGHDLVVLPNGHALLMSYDRQTMDMSVIVPGGNPMATVIGLIIQEIDTNKNVVFQWRSWDHFAITDMNSCETNLLGATVDYAHGNAIELDTDGDIMISSRNMNEITKISRTTGNVIWRLGGNALQNEFTIVGDPRGFSHQHDIRRLANGNITVFDNGNCIDPTRSRAVEYQLDEVNKIATQVWEYRHTPEQYGGFTGSARRLPDGGTIIGWGGTIDDPKVTEIHANGSTAWELSFNNASLFTYRAPKYPWDTKQFTTETDSLDFGSVLMSSQSTLPLKILNTTSTPRTITCFVSSDPKVEVLDAPPVVVPANGEVTVQVRYTPAGTGPLDATLYLRSVTSTELVARSVELTGQGVANLPIAAAPGVAALAGLLLAAGAWRARSRRRPDA